MGIHLMVYADRRRLGDFLCTCSKNELRSMKIIPVLPRTPSILPQHYIYMSFTIWCIRIHPTLFHPCTIVLSWAFFLYIVLVMYVILANYILCFFFWIKKNYLVSMFWTVYLRYFSIWNVFGLVWFYWKMPAIFTWMPFISLSFILSLFREKWDTLIMIFFKCMHTFGIFNLDSIVVEK